MFLLLIVILRVSGNLLPLKDDSPEKHSLSQCVISAVNYFTDYGEVVSIVISNLSPRKESTVPFDYILFNDISLRNEISYIIKKAETIKLHEGYTKSIAAYVIYIRRVDELVLSLNLIINDLSWNPHANFLIISTYLVGENVADIFDITWKFRILNLVVLLPNQSDEAYDVYTGYPYGKCGVSIDTRKIDRCINGYIEKRDWFPDKVPTNLNGCEIGVVTHIIEPFVVVKEENMINNSRFNLLEGFEIKLLNTIAQYNNFTVKFSVTDTPRYPYGNIFPNRSVTGSFLKLNKREVDVIMGYMVSGPDTQRIFDVTAAYFQDSLVFCVPRAKQLKGLMILSQNLDNSVLLILIALCFIVSSLVYYSRNIEVEKIRAYRKFPEILTNVFKLMIGISVTKLPLTKVNRFILIFWIISTYWFHLLYTTILIKSLSSFYSEHQISTFEEILEFRKTIQYYSLCSNYLDMQKLSGVETILCKNYLECLNRTVLNEKYVTCMPKLNVQYLSHNFLDADGYSKLSCFKDNIVTYPIQMLMWKGHPLKPRINTLVNRLSAGGFIQKWKKDVFYELRKDMKEFVASDRIVLTLSHLGIPFLLLSIIHPLSCLIFLIELVTYRYRNNN